MSQGLGAQNTSVSRITENGTGVLCSTIHVSSNAVLAAIPVAFASRSRVIKKLVWNRIGWSENHTCGAILAHPRVDGTVDDSKGTVIGGGRGVWCDGRHGRVGVWLVSFGRRRAAHRREVIGNQKNRT